MLLQTARSKGIRGLTAMVLIDNHAMLHLFNKAFPSVQSRIEDGTYQLTMEFDTPPR